MPLVLRDHGRRWTAAALVTAIAVIAAASPTLRWTATHPRNFREIWRIHKVASLVEKHRLAASACPDEPTFVAYLNESGALQCEEGSRLACIEYGRPPDLPLPDDCALSYRTGFFSDDRHVYLTHRGIWTDRGDWFRGRRVWQLMTESEQANVLRKEAERKEAERLR